MEVTSEQLIEYLRLGRWLQSPEVISAFATVDRALFVPELLRRAAYLDQPLQVGPMHISAPFVYALALESLQIEPNLRFLNIGSGTGYFSALAHRLIGNGGANHAIEIKLEVIEQARANIHALEERLGERIDIMFVLGNGLALQSKEPYDRIYVGAGCKLNDVFMEALFPLLKCPGGILVAPFEGYLKRIVRVSRTEFQSRNLARAHFASIQPVTAVDRRHPPRLPAKVWSPDSHCTFPDMFKCLIFWVLLVAKRQDSLPVGIWCEILSYLHCSDVSEKFRSCAVFESMMSKKPNATHSNTGGIASGLEENINCAQISCVIC
mmetsp:Transcript_36786/g.46898  ORF Transcript_36786/g.46898 Transcript_36786/m.46898 type:complete len:322 (-) Transcript_36786:91-1056(-)